MGQFQMSRCNLFQVGEGYTKNEASDNNSTGRGKIDVGPGEF